MDLLRKIRPILGILASLLLSFLLAHGALAIAVGETVLDLSKVDFDAGALVDLADSDWEVWPNELLAPSELSAEGRRIRLDKAWTAVIGDNLLAPHQGMMTLRLRIKVPPSSPPLVFGAGFSAPARLFIDGVDVGANGIPDSGDKEQISTLRARIPLPKSEQHEIVLQISYRHHGTSPDFLSRPVIGTPSAYTKRGMVVSAACIGLAAILIVIGIISLTVGFKADFSGPFLWLSLLTFSAAARYAITARAHFFDLQDGFSGIFWFGPQPIFIPFSAIGQIATVMVIARLFPSEIMRRGRNFLIALAISRPILWFLYPNFSIVVFDWQLRDIGRLDRDYNVIIFVFWTYFFVWLSAICMRQIRSGGPYGRLTLITLSAAIVVMIIENVTEAVYFSTSSSMLLELITGMLVMYVLVDQFGEARRNALALADDLQKTNLGLEATVEERTQTLTQALYRQTATSEVLRIIATAQDQPNLVFDAIQKNVEILCRCDLVALWRIEGSVYSVLAESYTDAPTKLPITLHPESPMSRLIETKDVIHTHDIREDEGYKRRFSYSVHVVEKLGVRTAVHIPMIKDDIVIGAISARRKQVLPFTESEIELLKSFANQAVIALENARLLGVLRERTFELETNVQRLQETQRQLVQAEKMSTLGTLVAGVAHEINTPLGIAVTATSQLIRDADEIRETIANGQLSRGKLDGFVKGIDRGLGIAYSNLTRAANLVSSFKQVAVDQNSEQARDIDLADYIKDILRSLDPILKSAKVQVEQSVPAGIKLKTQPGALAQVVTNLVQNAIKHAFDGIAEPRLSFSANIVSAAEIQLIMTDNGVGMDDTIRARAFDPFFTTKRGAGGTGLGLHIVHNLMTEALKGRIELNSRPDHGTEFRLTFPV